MPLLIIKTYSATACLFFILKIIFGKVKLIAVNIILMSYKLILNKGKFMYFSFYCETLLPGTLVTFIKNNTYIISLMFLFHPYSIALKAPSWLNFIINFSITADNFIFLFMKLIE